MIEPIIDSETKLERLRRLNRERQQRFRDRRNAMKNGDEIPAKSCRENPEQRKLRLAAAAQAARERRSVETQETRELRQLKDALATQARRYQETEVQRELRLAAVAQATRKRRAEETQQQREIRRISNALANQARRDRETEMQRKLRLAAVAQAARERRAARTKIEISPTELIEYNGPQAIKTEAREEDASMDKSVLTSDDYNLEETDSSNLEEYEDEAMESIYLSSDKEGADQSTKYEEDVMNSDTDKLLSIKREPAALEKTDGIGISYEGFRIKSDPQMLAEKHIEWNAVKTHPKAIKVESIETKTEPYHMLERDPAEAISGNGIAIKKKIITCENDENKKRSDEQREFLLNQNSIDSCPLCSDIKVLAESVGVNKSIFTFDSSETTAKKENDIHCDQQISSTNLPRAKAACGHDFVTDYIDTPEEAMKLLEMLANYAATTENSRAMIVLSQLEEALKE